MSDNKVARGNAAKRLAEDPLLTEALANIRAAAFRAFEASKVADEQERRVAWITVKVVNRIEAELQSIIDDGMLAAARVQHPIR